MITIRDGLRFQSFPDDFQLISKTQRNYYVQVGNAVPPLLSKAWADHFKGYFNIPINQKNMKHEILSEAFYYKDKSNPKKNQHNIQNSHDG
ncbi:MAG: DNA cytosine methyltransferase [Flavobacterium sp.]